MKRWIPVAVGLLIVSVLAFAGANRAGGWWMLVTANILFPGLSALVVAQSSSDGGVRLSWALVFAGVFGFTVNGGGIGISTAGSTSLELRRISLLVSVTAALSLGSVCYLVGAAGRSLSR